MMNTSEGTAAAFAPAVRGGRSRLAVLGAAAVLAVGLAACEGDNLYTGEGPSFDPRILEIAAPDTVFAGDTVAVRVDAAAARAIEQIVVSVSGAATVDTVVKLDEPKQQVAQVVRIGIPQLVQDTVLRIKAFAIDAVGATSGERQLTLTAVGPPVISGVSGPSGVRPGDVITVRVNAKGTDEINRLDIAARGAITRDTTVFIVPPGRTVEQDVSFTVPGSVQDTVVTFIVTAQDVAGRTSVPASGMVPFAIDTPKVAMIVPSSVEAGRILNIGLQAESLRQITEVRVELRGGVIQDLVFPINPARARTIEYISIPLPPDLIVPQLRVRGFALDRSQAYSATDVELVDVPSEPPVVVSLDLVSTVVTAGHWADVRVTAVGARPIRQLRLRWRGFPAGAEFPVNEDEFSVGPEQHMNVDPPNTVVVQDVGVAVPCVVGDATLMLLVTAYDEDDRVSAIATEFVNVLGDPSCVPEEEEPEPEDPAPRAPGFIRPGVGARR